MTDAERQELSAECHVELASGQQFVFNFDGSRDEPGNPNFVQVMVELFDGGKQIAVGMRVPDIICGKRHACRAQGFADYREGVMDACHGLADWLEDSREDSRGFGV